MASQVEHLLALAETESEAGRWLASAIRAWCEGQPWTVAAGISPSQVSRGIRDRHLQHAGELIGGDPVELHRLAGKFEACVWPRWRRSGLPADAGPVNRLLFLARQAAPLPKSVKQFRRILGHQTHL